jgi:CelD/BcsL family acetyltransferase involved in cellulose biosynthesis
MPLQVEIVDSASAFEALAPEWNGLLASSRAQGVFLSHEWLLTSARHFSAPGELLVLTIRDRRTLIGALPLARRERPARPLPTVEFIGERDLAGDFLDVIVKPGREDDVADALGREIAELPAVLDLAAVPHESLGAHALSASLGRAGWDRSVRPWVTCPFVPLTGHTVESYIATLTSHHRSNFTRRLRTLERTFGLSFTLVTGDAERQAAIDALAHLSVERWRGRGGSAAFGTPQFIGFHQDVTSALQAAGWLRLFVLRLGDRIGAIVYATCCARKYALYQHGFAPQFARFGAGQVAVGLAIRHAIEEGATEFDFLRGAEPYKFDWTQSSRELVLIELSPPGWRGQLHRAAKRAKHAARRVLLRHPTG